MRTPPLPQNKMIWGALRIGSVLNNACSLYHARKGKTKSKRKQDEQRRRKMVQKMREHVAKFQMLNQEFDEKALPRNPMDMVGVLHTMRLQFSKDAVAYAKTNKLNSLKELRTFVL